MAWQPDSTQPVGGLLGRQLQDQGWLGSLPAPAVF